MGAIAAFARLSGHQRIDGQLMRAGGESIAVIDPATEERIGEIAEAPPATSPRRSRRRMRRSAPGAK